MGGSAHSAWKHQYRMIHEKRRNGGRDASLKATMNPEFDHLFEEALRLLQTGALKQGEQICRQLIASYADAPDAWNMLAIALYQQGQLDEAAQTATHATQLRPQIPPYWLTRGNIAMARHRYREAQSSFRRAIEIDSGYAEAHYRLGMSYHREFRYPEAAAAYREALRYAPDVAEIHCQFAEALVSAGQFSEAICAYQEAFERDAHGELDRRGCLDLLSRSRFDSLPDFWDAEITRIFRREDIDKALYVNVGLNALKVKSGFRAALGQAAAPDARLELDASTLRKVLGDPLFHILLRDCLIADAEFEAFLTRLRTSLLLDAGMRAQASTEFLCAFALQCFHNEFIYTESELETNRIAELLLGVEDMLETCGHEEDPAIRPLLVLASYRPLSTVRGIGVLFEQVGKLPELDELLRRSVLDAQIEHDLRREIVCLGEITDAVSCAVREMYEEHPYPRWFTLDRGPPLTIAEWLERELPAAEQIAASFSARILVAGCGTGRDAIWLASNIANSDVLAVDLSLSSLAYAQRMARMMGVANVEFRQADILGLGGLSDRFDIISSTGVLHHMREPQAGLRVLARLLRPGGLLKLGLYSARARAGVNAARKMIRKWKISATEPEIRKFRQRVLKAEKHSSLWDLRTSHDFYSMSTCRDLLFHVQEHQFQLPQIATMLKEIPVSILGLADLSQHVVSSYRRMFPDDDLMVNLLNWDAFEAQYPDTFRAMFNIWCRTAD